MLSRKRIEALWERDSHGDCPGGARCTTSDNPHLLRFARLVEAAALENAAKAAQKEMRGDFNREGWNFDDACSYPMHALRARARKCREAADAE